MTSFDNFDFGNWTKASSTLPVNSGQAVGSWDGSIILLGGFESKTQIIEYSSSQDTFTGFTNYGTAALLTHVFGHGQFYSQTNENVYIIANEHEYIIANDNVYIIANENEKDSYIWRVNLISKRSTLLSEVPLSTSLNTYDIGHACVASINDLIYILGGAHSNTTSMNALQIFNISNGTWSTNPPQMVFQRRQLACVVHPSNKYLYALGGLGLDTIERISTDDIMSDTWLGQPALLYITYEGRAVAYDDTILIIGGRIDSTAFVPQLQIMDINKGTVHEGPYYNYVSSATAVAVLQNILYSFGGINVNNTALNTWQYLSLWEIAQPTMERTTSFSAWQYIGFGTLCIFLFVMPIVVCIKQYRKVDTEGEDEPYPPHQISETPGKVRGFRLRSLSDILQGRHGDNIGSTTENVDIDSMTEKVDVSKGKLFKEMDRKEDLGDEKEVERVKSWLLLNVGLVQYLSCFLDNGYDTLEYILNITEKSELNEIGITIKGHQTHIMTEINKLKKDLGEKEHTKEDSDADSLCEVTQGDIDQKIEQKEGNAQTAPPDVAMPGGTPIGQQLLMD